MSDQLSDPRSDEATVEDGGRHRAASVAETIGAVLAHAANAAGTAGAEDAQEIQAIADAMVRLLVGAPLHSDGQLTIKSLADEAGLKRNKLTHKHTNLKDLFYALIRSQQDPPKPLTDREREKTEKLAKDLKRVREERDELKARCQQFARVIQVLEVEKQQLAESKEALEQKLAAQSGVSDLAEHRGRART
ncbi:hypothetical protein [Streptomyces sp. NPDC004296]|uniref:hypothetical protein n=1 Tax=Streptomyces sp. NPDC004296 TaxID=3364697 RepID=UPI00367B3E57